LAPLAAAIVSAEPETAVPAAVAVADVSVSIGATAAPSPIKEPAFKTSRLLELAALSLGCEREESHISIGEEAAVDAAIDNSTNLRNVISRNVKLGVYERTKNRKNSDNGRGVTHGVYWERCSTL